VPVLPSRPHRARRRTTGAARLWALLAVVVLVSAGCSPGPETGGPAAGDGELTGFVQAAGRGLTIDGEPTRLKAVNFTNGYDAGIEAHELLTFGHHAERDYERVADLGFNSIRFAFQGKWYVQDPEAFWAWLDQNVEWARDHGVRLILDLHIPIGGYWLGSDPDSADFRLWTDDGLRQQNVDLWASIAERYRDEPTVAAYDLLNEPVTTDSSGEQWRSLAQDTVDAIRSVDPNHLLVIGAVYGTDGGFDPEGVERHLLVDDDNAMYDFHFYDPYRYTHQFASWVPNAQDGGSYPDPDRLLRTTDAPRVLEGNRIATPSLPTGTSAWKEYDSGLVTIEDLAAAAASPQVVVEGGMEGTAHFDGIRVTEYGPDGTELREVLDDPLDEDSTTTWYPWTGENGADSSVNHTRSARDTRTKLSPR
jgi:endoglucanase